MTSEEARTRLKQLSESQGLYDFAFLRGLDEFDEPPLFTRISQVAFLHQLPHPERALLAAEWAVGLLDAYAHAIASLPRAAQYFLCLTFQDWDRVDTGELPIATPALFLSPRSSEEIDASFRLAPVLTQHGKSVGEWIAALERPDLLVGEPVHPIPDDDRVYVGYRVPAGFKSVGTCWSTSQHP